MVLDLTVLHLEHTNTKNNSFAMCLACMYVFLHCLQDLNTMEMETEYRRRQHEVGAELLNRLEYHVKEEAARRGYEHKHMIDWIEGQVTEALKGKQVSSSSSGGYCGEYWSVQCYVGWVNTRRFYPLLSRHLGLRVPVYLNCQLLVGWDHSFYFVKLLKW